MLPSSLSEGFITAPILSAASFKTWTAAAMVACLCYSSSRAACSRAASFLSACSCVATFRAACSCAARSWTACCSLARSSAAARSRTAFSWSSRICSACMRGEIPGRRVLVGLLLDRLVGHLGILLVNSLLLLPSPGTPLFPLSPRLGSRSPSLPCYGRALVLIFGASIFSLVVRVIWSLRPSGKPQGAHGADARIAGAIPGMHGTVGDGGC